MFPLRIRAAYTSNNRIKRAKSKCLVILNYLGSGVLTIKTLSKTLDVPFGSYFQNEERWTVEPLEGDKC